MSAGDGGGEEARKGPQPRSLACGGTLLAMVYLFFFFLGPLRPARQSRLFHLGKGEQSNGNEMSSRIVPKMTSDCSNSEFEMWRRVGMS